MLSQINKRRIEDARYMQGVTVFSKFKKLKSLEGYKIHKLRDTDLIKYNKLLIKAILDLNTHLMLLNLEEKLKKYTFTND